jgi:pimeloyl-ACP methyl ester carboxylesterase
MPVLALGGDRCLGEAPLRSMAALAKNVKGGVVERCGHWIPEERPEYLINQLIGSLLILEFRLDSGAKLKQNNCTMLVLTHVR